MAMKMTTAAKKSGDATPCDVLILGSGLAGSVTASILARNGADVVLIDAGQHPRFAIGESTTPQLVEWLHILSERYQVPEIKSLTSVDASTRDIGPVFGTKIHFGFMRHQPGQEPNPREATQFAIPRLLAQTSHLYRQDSDSYMFHVAVRYGATVRQNWRATDLDFDDDGVTVTGHTGEVFRAKYLIDASGFRSPLAEKFDLREKPARFKHHSRSMFTHFIGVKPFDQVSEHPKHLRPPVDWHKGTMHHLIDRGWFWIIPFDSHPKSKNPLCSVGLQLDERRYPKPTDITPEEEFQRYLDMYPAVKRQFEGARRVRDWVSTDRLQYSSKQTIGDRWCLMSHAAGFIDPLYSRGLSNTFEVVDALSSRLLQAIKDDDFSTERFEYVEEVERGLLHYNDELVNSSFIAFSHFRLWNAVFRVWGAFITPGVMRLARARLRYMQDGNDWHFRDLENVPHPGLWWPEGDAFKRILETTAETCEKYEVGELTGDEAADIIFQVLQESDEVNPEFGWKDPEHRFVAPNTLTLVKFMRWASTESGPEMKRLGRELLKELSKVGPRARKLL
ncbi:NAD(P)-binding protein [Streptomyces sp. TRM43335]|uniref:NAD(P)-binding protein n=1 Tax=Streptomyces taklimakanensis TaxID=2569853 RepID=A0A6G2BFE2_9ACTN|nr:tryptophan 7-halogenase [Streptomyces taklimakanensis]MTE21001.1 NAD(P)-binding protein [Streptomyces taklimakanensis]